GAREPFLALGTRAGVFHGARGPLTAWLQRIARNRAVDHLRAAGRHHRAATFPSVGRAGADNDELEQWLTSTGELIATAGPEPGPELALSSKETRASIEGAVATLTPH